MWIWLIVSLLTLVSLYFLYSKGKPQYKSHNEQDQPDQGEDEHEKNQPNQGEEHEPNITTSQKSLKGSKKGASVKKKPKKSTVEKQQKKSAREERRRMKEEEELKKLKEETKQFKEAEDAAKIQRQKIAEIKAYARQKMTEKEREAQREENLRSRQMFLEEERRLEEEHKNKIKKEIISVWGVQSEAIMSATPSFKQIQAEDIEMDRKRIENMTEFDLKREKYRKDRRSKRKDIEESLGRLQEQNHVFEERTQKFKTDPDKSNEIDKNYKLIFKSKKKSDLER